MTKPPIFYVYAVLFGIGLFFELVYLRRKNTEMAITWIAILFWIFIGLMNARVWAEM